MSQKVHTVWRVTSSAGLPTSTSEHRFWLVRSTPRPEVDRDQIAAALDSHLDWIVGLEKSGAVFLSGPLTSGPEVRPGCGVTVLRAESSDDAKAIALHDPFVRLGLRTFEVFEWLLKEGKVSLDISLSEGSCQWD